DASARIVPMNATQPSAFFLAAPTKGSAIITMTPKMHRMASGITRWMSRSCGPMITVAPVYRIWSREPQHDAPLRELRTHARRPAAEGDAQRFQAGSSVAEYYRWK